MATFYSDVQDGLNNTPVELPASAQVHGEVRAATATIDLATNDVDDGDDVELFKLPKGARVLYGLLTTNVTLATATVAIGITGSTGKYRAAAVDTTINLPELFGVQAGLNEPLSAEETVLLTVATADLPNSAGNEVIVTIFYATD